MTIRYELRTTKKAADGERVPLHVSVSDGRDFRKRQVTKILIEPSWWDAKAAELKKRVLIPEAERSVIAKEMLALRSYISEAYGIDKEKDKIGPAWLEKMVDNYYKGKSQTPKKRRSRKKSFDELFTMFADGREISPSRTRHYHVLQRMIHRYEAYVRASLPGKSRYVFDIDDEDLDTLNDLRDYIRNEHLYVAQYPQIMEARPERRKFTERSENYLHGLFKLIKAFYAWCIKGGYTKNWPFTDFEMPKEEYGTPVIMTLDEVEHLYLAKMPTKMLEEQRDIFVFQCNVGCRVGDLMSYTKDSVQNGALEYIAAKTLHFSGRTVVVPLNSIALEIVDKYKDRPGNRLLPFISEQNYNDNIKAAFTAAGITRLVTELDPVTRKEVKHPLNEIASSHLARRTFAGNIYRQVKDPNLVASLTGHAEGSRAFNRYREIDLGMKQDLVRILENKRG